MGIFNEQSSDHPFAKGIQGAPGIGFNLTSGGDYDMINKKLRNVGAPSANGDAATKKYVDDNSGAATTSSLTIDSNINMKDTYRITNLKTPVDTHEPPTKYYVDNTFLDRDGSSPMKGNLNMDNNRILNLPAPTGSNQPTPLAFTDMKYLHVAGTNKMTNNLNMDNKKIINLRPPTSNTDATTKKYVDDAIPDTSSFIKKDGSIVMTGDFNTGGHKILNLRTPTTNSEPATKKYVDDNTAAPDLSDYLEKDGTVTMTGNLNLGNNKIVNLSDPATDQQAANRGWVRKQIDRLDHLSGDVTGGVFTIKDPASPTTLYLQYVSGSSFDDFVFTTSAPGQPLVGWAPTANTYINRIDFQFGSRNVNVDFLWFIPRDSSKSNSTFWVSGNRTGNWSLNIRRSWGYDMSGVKLRTHNNSNHTAITCRYFHELPYAITEPLKKIEINTPKIVISGIVKADVNLGGNKINNLGGPTQDNEAVTKGYVDNLVHHNAVQPSHYKDEFSYLMASGAQWTDEMGGIIYSFFVKSIGDLTPSKGNFHDYNHKVIFLTIIKNYLSRKYIYKMGINFYRLAANTDYTLCLEILNTDYNLWNNSQISADKGTSTGLSIGNVSVKKLTHSYTNTQGTTSTMYYHKVIINFRKLSSGNKFFLHILVDILRGGYNIALYPRQFSGVYLVAYGIKGTFSNIDSDKVYDYHTAFDIRPTEVKYNVNINANLKEIKNIKLNRNSDNSAATVALVKELVPFTKNALYNLYFNEFYDFADADIYGINTGSSGIIINSLKPSITLPANKDLDEIIKGGLKVNGYDVTFSPSYSSIGTLCIVISHLSDRSFSLTKYLPSNNSVLVKLDYNKTSGIISLSANNIKHSFSLVSSLHGKVIVLWLTESSNANVTKVSISNYSAVLNVGGVSYNVNQRWKFTSDEGVLYKLMYSPKFYDTDSVQYHKVMLQEKLNGSKIL